MKQRDQRVSEVVRRLKAAWPDAHIALRFDSPFELLVATILSAQCTDERVNRVTEGLFRKYRGVEAFADADPAELEQDVRPTGFFRNKARNIRGAARMILERFGGVVPRSMDDLLSLPGVARKTANVVQGNAFGIVDGIVVDTHVIRVSGRLGMAGGSDPVRIERQLMTSVPREDWLVFSCLMQALGREVCTARSPKHDRCVLRDICPSSGVKAGRRGRKTI